MTKRHRCTIVITITAALASACGPGDTQRTARSEPAVDSSTVSVSREIAESEFCTTFADFNLTSIWLHGGESVVRPGLLLKLERIETLQALLPDELADNAPALATLHTASTATFTLYEANGFDATKVDGDPTYNDVARLIGASLQADVVNGATATRAYCGITL